MSKKKPKKIYLNESTITQLKKKDWNNSSSIEQLILNGLTKDSESIKAIDLRTEMVILSNKIDTLASVLEKIFIEDIDEDNS